MIILILICIPRVTLLGKKQLGFCAMPCFPADQMPQCQSQSGQSGTCEHGPRDGSQNRSRTSLELAKFLLMRMDMSKPWPWEDLKKWGHSGSEVKPAMSFPSPRRKVLHHSSHESLWEKQPREPEGDWMTCKPRQLQSCTSLFASCDDRVQNRHIHLQLVWQFMIYFGSKLRSVHGDLGLISYQLSGLLRTTCWKRQSYHSSPRKWNAAYLFVFSLAPQVLLVPRCQGFQG